MVACPVCEGVALAPFFRSREWSSSLVYLADDTSYAPRDPLPIMLEYCRTCGFVRQAPGFEVTLDYTGRERDTAKQLPDYASRIIASLAESAVAPDDLVVEVGANDGTFLRALRATGHRHLMGVEPSTWLAAKGLESGLAVVNDYFGRRVAADLVRLHGQARAVFCRHTLEHVPDIRDLTQGIADLLAPGGLGFIEVPDTDWIISDLFAHEIWDEHISYFRAGSLARLLRSCGLTPLRIERVRFRDTRNLLCWAQRDTAESVAPAALLGDATSKQEMAGFQERWDAFAARLRAVVGRAPRPLIAVGASHIQVNFLNYAGLDGSVDLMIDDDPTKAGHYAPLARAVPIRSTADVLQSVRAGTVLRTAFPYPAWEDRICDALAPHGIAAIKPYDHR